jgi:hypothetical protein
MSVSRFNNWNAPLAGFGSPGDDFNGSPEATGAAACISVVILCSTQTTLKVEQNRSINNPFIFEDEYTIQPGVQTTIQVRVVLPYFRVNIINDTMTTQTYMNMNTMLLAQLTRNVDIRPLTAATDSVNVDVSGVILPVQGTVAVSNFPTLTLVGGQNNNYAFYPTAANNTAEIYADGTKGTDVVGGWQYINQITGEINWYCYGSPGSATDYKLSQLGSMYTVINQQSTLGLATAQNPFIIVYTRPTGDGDALWYKSKYFFGSNAHTDISGTKLLYTGEDPVDIHPEITGINRIQLLFVLGQSTKTLAAGADESIWTSALKTTNNTSPVGSYNFTMLEFGAVWETVESPLPIEFGRVQCDVQGTVGLTPSITTATYTQPVTDVSFNGTAFDMGENSLVDVLLLANATGAANGSVRLDYSIDGTTWYPDNTNLYPITTTDLHYVISGKKTASRYIRVSTGGGSTFRTSNLTMVYSSKRN